MRPTDSRAYAIINDSETTPSSSVIDALRNYDVHPLLWSNRNASVQDLAA
ncbi:MAG: DUF1829 domain-containing protein [Pyrinomonadaceae bacterium]